MIKAIKSKTIPIKIAQILKLAIRVPLIIQTRKYPIAQIVFKRTGAPAIYTNFMTGTQF